MKKILLVLTVFLAVNIIYSQSTSIPSATGSGSSYYQTVQDEGSSVTQRATLNFAGSGVNCADDTTKTTCTISGGSASAVTDLTDCKVTVSGATATMAACRYEYTASDGRNVTVAMSSATWAIAAGTESATSPPARFEIDPNNGSPIIRCIYPSTMTASNYTATGCTETAGEDFSVGTKPLATLALSSGAWSTLTDVRSMLATHTVTAGNGISKSGNVMAVNTGYGFAWGAAQSSDSTYNYCADAGANDTYACTISPAITAYATGAHYFFKANTVNTGAATINLNSLGAKTIKKYTGTGGADLADADIRAGAIVHVIYDGTNMQLVNQLGNAGSGGGVQRVAYASKPTCDSSYTNVLFKLTDTSAVHEYHCNGTSEQAYFGSMPVTPVPSASWTTVNSPTITAALGTYTLETDTTSTWMGSVRAVPGSTPYTVTACALAVLLDDTTDNTSYPGVSMIVTDGTTNTSDIVGMAAYVHSGNTLLQVQTETETDWANTGQVSTQHFKYYPMGAPVICMQYEDNGTNRIWRIGASRSTLRDVKSETRTTSLTATHIGIRASANASGLAQKFQLIDWTVE